MSETVQRLSNIPVPDPSEITSREIAEAKVELRNEFSASMNSNIIARELIREVLETRLDAMDKASVVLAENVNRVPTLLDRESSRLEKLFEEKLTGMMTKFDGIQVQFRERDIRTDQDKIAASTAVNAALQAQKEAAGAQNESNAAAITKSENSFTKEIDSLKSLINTVRDAIQSDVANLKGRLDRGEGGTNGVRQSNDDHRSNIGTIVGIVGAAIGVLTFFGAMFYGSQINRQQASISIPPPASIQTR